VGTLVELLRWWAAELAGMLPGAGRRRSGRRRDALVVRLCGEELALGRSVRGGAVRELATVPIAGAGGGPRDADLVSRLYHRYYDPGSTALEVVIGKDSTLARTVRLPLAAEENLRGVLGFEMERLTPFRADDVYFDGSVVSKDPQTRQMQVTLRVAPSRVVDAALNLLPGGAEQVERDRVSFRDTEEGVAIGFAPPEVRRGSSSFLPALLVAVNVGLLAAAVWIPIAERRDALAALSAEVEAAALAAAEANAVQARIDALRAELTTIVALKAGRPSVVEILEEVAARLPDSTWLQRIHLKSDSLEIIGTSNAASGLIEVLESSRLLSDPRFVSPVTQEPGSGRERFHIAVRLSPAVAGGGAVAAAPPVRRGGPGR